MSTRPFFSERAIRRRKFILGLIYSWNPDFKELSAITTVPDHRSMQDMQALGQFLIPKAIVVRRDRKSRSKIHCVNNFFRLLAPEVLALPMASHTSPYHAAAVTKFGQRRYNTKATSFTRSIFRIFVISRLITKFTKILCHENLELYGILRCHFLFFI